VQQRLSNLFVTQVIVAANERPPIRAATKQALGGAIAEMP